MRRSKVHLDRDRGMIKRGEEKRRKSFFFLSWEGAGPMTVLVDGDVVVICP